MKIETYTFEKLVLSWKRMQSRLNQLVNQIYMLRKSNTELRRQLIVREDKIRSQANTLRHIHEAKQLQNSQKTTNVSS